jgi:hypothetical protein
MSDAEIKRDAPMMKAKAARALNLSLCFPMLCGEPKLFISALKPQRQRSEHKAPHENVEICADP